MDDYEARSLYTEGTSSNVQRCLPEDSLTESRSCGQVENGTPSTSPPYWDTDGDDDDCGPKPSALYGKFTWKIENFSQINKRELRSNAFEVGSYKWYILIYPQGCDVCNHLSLFLCVANHDKLLPGWSHFAQFTISVVNKDPKKSKYSDTLHRFWKKEHDWGWKKFMELSKVADGFVNDDDSLLIKAQVQVIREKAHRPFRCLDCQYRRELVRVYLTNVEQICRRFIEERKGKLNKLIEDKVRWSSFRAFWLKVDQITRQHLSRDKTDAILKVVVKNFFVEKEVTSTLVMDSLYSGLKALEFQSKNQKDKVRLVEMEELPAPMVYIDEDMFVLADDVLLLLQRAAADPLPHQPLPPKDDKGSHNRTKDGSSGAEFNKDSIAGDERRLTEVGRRTVEILALVHIFSSRIEVAYQEAVALKRQEELIREEEAAEQAEIELKAKRSAAEKEKRLKKKQAKQRRNSRKGKDRAKDEKSDAMMQDQPQQESPSDEIILEDLFPKQGRLAIGKIDALENGSDLSDTGDDFTESPHADKEDRHSSPINWDADSSEIHPAMEADATVFQNEKMEKRTTAILDYSSSTCSTDSIPSLMNGSYKGNSLINGKTQTLPNRGNSQGTKDAQSTTLDTRHIHSAASRSRATTPEPDATLLMEEQTQWPEVHYSDEKEVEFGSRQKKVSVKDPVDMERASDLVAADLSTSSAGRKPSSSLLNQQRRSSDNTTNSTKDTTSGFSTTETEPTSVKESPLDSAAEAWKPVPPAARSPQIPSASRSEVQRPTMPPKSAMSQQTASISRPCSAPLIPAPKPTVPVTATVPTTPQLSRSASAAGRLGMEPSPFAPSYIPQSYRNAIIGKTTVGTSPAGPSHLSLLPSSQGFASAASTLPSQLKPDQFPTEITFGSVKPETLKIQRQWRDDHTHAESSSSAGLHNSNLAGGIDRLNIYGGSQVERSSRIIPSSSQGSGADEFPHLDIINDLLDEDKSIPRSAAAVGHYDHPYWYHHPNFNRQYSLPGGADIGSFNSTGLFDLAEQHYDEGIFQRVYSSASASPLHGLRDSHYSQTDLLAYASGQMEGMSQNQWAYGPSAADRHMINLGNADVGGYHHELPDNSYMTRANGYSYRRPGGGR